MIRAIAALLLIAPAAFSAGQTVGQTQSSPPSFGSFVTEASRLLSKSSINSKDIHQRAEQVIKKYRGQLKGLGGRVTKMEGEAGEMFGHLGWQERANLLAELWRIRSSIDLMDMVTPEVLSGIIGVDQATFGSWKARVKAVTTSIKKSMPYLPIR